MPDVVCPVDCNTCERDSNDKTKAVCHACYQKVIDGTGQCTAASPIPNCRTFKPYGCSTCVDGMMREFDIYGKGLNDRKFVNCVPMPASFADKCLIADKAPQEREGKAFCLITKVPGLITKAEGTIIDTMTSIPDTVDNCHQYAEIKDEATGKLKTSCWLCKPGFYHEAATNRCLAYNETFKGCTRDKGGACIGCNTFTEKYQPVKITRREGKDHFICSSVKKTETGGKTNISVMIGLLALLLILFNY